MMSKKLLLALVAIAAFVVLSVVGKISGNDAVEAIKWALIVYVPSQAVVDATEAYANGKNG